MISVNVVLCIFTTVIMYHIVGGFLVAEEVFRHFAHIYANHFLRNFMETDQIISLTCSGLNLIIMFIKFQSD